MTTSLRMTLQVDPEAAKIVFESGLNIVMVPLEVTHTALVTNEVMASIMNRRATPFLLLIREILSYFSDTYLEVFGFREPPLHDPCAVFAVIQPEAFKVRPAMSDRQSQDRHALPPVAHMLYFAVNQPEPFMAATLTV